MSYQRTVEELYALGQELAGTPSHKFDLSHVRLMLEALGNPERRFSSVLIAGTNGKGSTAATLASILCAAHHRTALYSSPHLVRINERMRVDGEPISDIEFGAIHQRVEGVAQQLLRAGKLPWHPSFFEMLTAMAFEYFASVGVDIAVLEVGMGGRLDATNVVEPLLSVISDISLDHQKYLGNTIAEIASEKAGIIRLNGVVVTLPQHPQANDVIGMAILEHDARGVSAARYVPPVSPGAGSYLTGDERGAPGHSRYPLTVMGEQITVDSPLVGRHQLRNVALAIAAAEELGHFGFRVTPRQIEQGIRDTRWPGRFQVIAASAGYDREMVLDVAHNPAGAWALRSALSENFSGRELTFIFAAMRDKAIQEIADILFPTAERVVLTQVSNPRAATTAELLQAAVRTGAMLHTEETVAGALRSARELSRADGVVVVTGSIYLVGEVIRELQIPA